MYLRDYITGANGGTIAFQLEHRPGKGVSTPGVVHSDALQLLAC
jgi:hypothetical protein